MHRWRRNNFYRIPVGCPIYENGQVCARYVFMSEKSKLVWLHKRISQKLSLSYKLWVSNPYLFATHCSRPYIFQTMNFVWSNKNKRFIPLGCKIIAVLKSEFVSKAQFHSFIIGLEGVFHNIQEYKMKFLLFYTHLYTY